MFVVLQVFCHENQEFWRRCKGNVHPSVYLQQYSLNITKTFCLLIFDSIGGTKLFCFVLFTALYLVYKKSLIFIAAIAETDCDVLWEVWFNRIFSLLLKLFIKKSLLTRNKYSSINGKRVFESVGSHFRKWMIKIFEENCIKTNDFVTIFFLHEIGIRFTTNFKTTSNGENIIPLVMYDLRLVLFHVM